jgi:hypothetical protein
MSNDLSIQAKLPILGSGDLAAPPRGNSAKPVATTPEAKPVKLYVNPAMVFDPTVGMVVMEFHDDTGALTNSVPTQRQLAAYRTHQEAPPGQTAALVANGKAASG